MISKPDHLEWQRQLEALITAYAQARCADGSMPTDQHDACAATVRHLGVDMGDVMRWARLKAKALAA